MIRYKIIPLAVAILVLPLCAGAYDMKNVIAYPVPFNPKKTTLKIANPSGYDLKAEIYDVNGDLVCEKRGSSTTVIWNGRNADGKLVKPGLYIIRITVEESSTGDYGKKIIRILVDY